MDPINKEDDEMISNTTRPRAPRTTTKKLVATAIAAGLATAQGLAQAVTISPNGTGQVLLYPYFSVNGGNSTLVSVVNSTDQAKAVKLRFREALNGANIFDFNLYLAPFDVWIASLNHHDSGTALFTADRSCTVPNDVAKDWVGNTPGVFSTFKPFDFESNVPDVVGTSRQVRVGGALSPITAADRMRQGYLEVIDMGNLLDEPAPSTFRPRAWTLHAGPITNRVPNNCGALEAAWTGGGANGQWLVDRGRAVLAANDGTTGQARVAGGGLFGAGTIVDVEFGRSLSYNAEALDGFFRADGLSGATRTLHYEPGDSAPSLAQARTGNDGVVTAHVDSNGATVALRFDEDEEGGLKAVSAALMARTIYNEYSMQNALAAETEWVVTFPTKRLHTYDRWLLDTRPFSDNQDIEPTTEPALLDEQPFDSTGLCETVSFTVWDRDTYERVPPHDQGPTIPQPPSTTPRPTSLCWNANLIAFNQSIDGSNGAAVLGATAAQGAISLTVDTSGDVFESGWARIELNDPLAAAGTFRNFLIARDGTATVGLPSIGFMAADFLNSNVAAGVRGNFGMAHRHRWISDGYANATDPGFAPSTQAPLPLNVTGLAPWASAIDPAASAPTQ